MKLALRSFALLALLVPAAVLSAGCEVKDCQTDDGEDATCLESLTHYADPMYNKQAEVDYVAGKNISINGVYGAIKVQEGVAGKVTATFAPFNWQSHNDEAQAYEQIRTNIDMVMEVDANEDVQVTTSRNGGGNGLGAEITVLIPPEFSGTLLVNNDSDGPMNPGNIEIDSVAQATALQVSTDNLGDCRINGAATVKSSNVVCSGEILLEHVSDSVIAQSSSDFTKDDVIVTIDAISDTSTGGTITADAGNVQVTFPNTGNFAIDANVAGAGTVVPGTTPSTCMLTEAAGHADVNCGNGGPIYNLAAGMDADYAGMIVLAYPAQ